MEARELRIGNWYKADITIQGSIGAKLGFGEDRMFKMTKEHLMLILRFDIEYKINPVPLTEEILLNCGFDKTVGGVDDRWSLDNFYIWEEEGSFSFMCNGDYIQLKFVHSIQNLYFCIEEKEIDICL
tara:strand:+ start:1658 stop:2038 length:381 start_codon:yes stop_codon:yes gene_type:complete